MHLVNKKNVKTIGTKYSRMDQVNLLNQTIIPSNVLKAVFHKFYLVHSWILGHNNYYQLCNKLYLFIHNNFLSSAILYL